jgi:hypothetical protein
MKSKQFTAGLFAAIAAFSTIAVLVTSNENKSVPWYTIALPAPFWIGAIRYFLLWKKEDRVQ